MLDDVAADPVKGSVVSFRTKLSGLSGKCTIISLWHKCNHKIHLLPVKALLELIFNGTCDKTLECYVAWCYTVMGIVRQGMCHPAKYHPKNTSICQHHFWTLSELLMKFYSQDTCCVAALATHSLFCNLNNHLIIKHLFFSSSISIPKPPWSFPL